MIWACNLEKPLLSSTIFFNFCKFIIKVTQTIKLLYQSHPPTPFLTLFYLQKGNPLSVPVGVSSIRSLYFLVSLLRSLRWLWDPLYTVYPTFQKLCSPYDLKTPTRDSDPGKNPKKQKVKTHTREARNFKVGRCFSFWTRPQKSNRLSTLNRFRRGYIPDIRLRRPNRLGQYWESHTETLPVPEP